MQKIGFDREKYIQLQAQHISQRRAAIGGKLYLEMGGKLFDDMHAARVLPGFTPDNKIVMLEQIKDELEIVIVVNAMDLERQKMRADLGITYGDDVLRLVDAFRERGFLVNSVVLTRADEALAAAVREAGFSADDFKPAYRCPLCEDTGMRGGVPCRCVADAARRLRRDEINAASPLGLCQFASFEVERYSDAVEPELGISPREYMGKLLNYCRGYAAKFSQNSPNLLFMGHTGLGKTHLALAIADAVLEGGHDVLYTSAAALAAQLGREHFNYTTNDEWLAACQEADLLILDDLGTEYITPLTISVLYELINTRMLTHRPTIYTTNITDQSVFVARYTEKVASRMLGGCKMFKFFGTDQRLK